MTKNGHHSVSRRSRLDVVAEEISRLLDTDAAGDVVVGLSRDVQLFCLVQAGRGEKRTDNSRHKAVEPEPSLIAELMCGRALVARPH